MDKLNKFGYTFKEEFANTVTHIVGILLSVIGTIIIITNLVINDSGEKKLKIRNDITMQVARIASSRFKDKSSLITKKSVFIH